MTGIEATEGVGGLQKSWQPDQPAATRRRAN